METNGIALGSKVHIRPIGEKRLAVHTRDGALVDRLLRIKGCLYCQDYWNDGKRIAWDVVFDSSVKRKLVRLLGKGYQLEMEL